jgi:hypothetical protein
MNEESCGAAADGDGDALGCQVALYFDGATLFAASVDPAQPARANGVPLGIGWTPLPFPAVLEIGQSRFLYEMARGGEGGPPPPEPRTMVRGSDPDALTRVWSRGALSSVLQRERAAAREREPATMVGRAPAEASAFEAAVVPAVSRTAESARTENTARRDTGFLGSLSRRARQRYTRMSRGTRRALLMLPVLALASYLVLSPDPDDAPRRPTRRPSPPPSAAAASAASAAPVHSETGASSVPAAQAPAPATLAPRGSDNTKGERTPEGRAIDAAARGAYGEAAALYDRLAQEHPDRPEFASAARILRARPRTVAP